MTKRNIGFFTSLIITVVTIILFATGSKLLTLAVDRNNSIPLGTFITWAGLISLPLSIYWSNSKLRRPVSALDKMLSRVLILIIILAVLWVPIAYLLAGNLAFNFSEKLSFQGGQDAMRLFWFFTYGIGLGPLIILIFFWISNVLSKSRP